MLSKTTDMLITVTVNSYYDTHLDWMINVNGLNWTGNGRLLKPWRSHWQSDQFAFFSQKAFGAHKMVKAVNITDLYSPWTAAIHMKSIKKTYQENT